MTDLTFDAATAAPEATRADRMARLATDKRRMALIVFAVVIGVPLGLLLGVLIGLSTGLIDLC